MKNWGFIGSCSVILWTRVCRKTASQMMMMYEVVDWHRYSLFFSSAVKILSECDYVL